MRYHPCNNLVLGARCFLGTAVFGCFEAIATTPKLLTAGSAAACSAGLPIPWLRLSQQDILLPPNATATIELTHSATALDAGTYRAQLCLFADYNHGMPAWHRNTSATSALLARLLPCRFHRTSGVAQLFSLLL